MVESKKDQLRKAKPIASMEEEAAATERDVPESTTSVQTVVGKTVGQAKDVASSAVNATGGFVTRTFYTVKNSWFGVKPIAKGIGKGVHKTAEFLNVSTALAGTILGVLVFGGGGAAAIGITNYNSLQTILRQDDYWDPCGELMEDAESSYRTTATVDDVDAERLEVAKKLWAVGKAFSWTDEMCAGMLGNIQAESGFDPYAVEGIYDEPFQLGPRKGPLFDDTDFNKVNDEAMDDYVVNWLFAVGYGSRDDINYDAYKFSNGTHVAGLGLIQFTGPRAERLLALAQEQNTDWFDLKLQTAAVFAQSRTQIQNFIDECDGISSTGEAGCHATAEAWCRYVEGIPYPDTRGEYAWTWYQRFHPISRQIEREYADFAEETVDLINSLTAGDYLYHAAARNNLKDVYDECTAPETTYDNSDLARAAVSYAWPHTDQATSHNNGTELFQYVHDAVAPGDPWYQSCDRGVTTAVRWSGADDDCPMGACPQTIIHFMAHPEQWEHVGTLSQVKFDELEPGDILNGPGHILMFVGNEIICEKYPDSPESYCSVSASIGAGCETGQNGTGSSRSPGCGAGIAEGYAEGIPPSDCHVFRYIGNYDGQLKEQVDSAMPSGLRDGT